MMNHEAKHLLDVGSVMAVVATLAGWLPNIAALLTIVWTTIRIIESKTFQRLQRFIFQRKQ